MKPSPLTWADRDANPVVKVEDLAWLEFERPDLDAAARFATDFGFAVAARTETELRLRGVRAGTRCVVVRKGARSRFVATAYRAASAADVEQLARETGVTAEACPGGGTAVTLTTPSGAVVRVVAGVEELPALAGQTPLTWNVGHVVRRTNASQRPAREPARVERLGHVVLESPAFQRDLAWYLGTLGLVVSDFLYFDGQRERGPIMAFLRCDRGAIPTDHHTLALMLGPAGKYVHSAYQVADLDAVAAGGAYLKDRGYRHAWGVGRHIEGSQIFDYWRDPDGLMFEHFADGDVFDSSVPAGEKPMTASGLSQWGPPVTKEFLDAKPTPGKLRDVVRALCDDTSELDLERLRGLLKVMSS